MSKQFQPYNPREAGQGIQSELPPIRTFIIWNEDDHSRGYEIIHKSYPASISGHEYTHLIFGKRARFAFASHDGSVSRTDCITFASALVNGTVTVFHIDLKGIGR
jgi:hypothetical protein